MVPSSGNLASPFLEYYPLGRKDSMIKSVASPEVCDFAVEKEESDTTLQLGYVYANLFLYCLFCYV